MKYSLTILILIFLAKEGFSQDALLDNKELMQIYNLDQSDRKGGLVDWNEVPKRDQERRNRVAELLDSNKVVTSNDYRNAAMVFQHGRDSNDFKMAVDLMTKSIELDSTASKWLLAATTDRYLLSIGKAQIYGTQYVKFGKDEPWQMSKMDTTIVSDSIRRIYNVRTLSEQKKRLEKLNSK